MPKLRPIKDEKQLAQIPVTEPVLVELEPPATGADIISSTEPEDKKVEKKLNGHDDVDPAVKSLKDQLEAQKEANRLSDERVQKAEQERREALRKAEEAERKAKEAQTQSVESERDLIQNSLSSAQSEQAALKGAYAQALEAGNFAAAADIQDKMGRTSAKILHLESAAAHMDRRAEEAKKQPERREQQVDASTLIENNNQLLPGEKDWLKKHPELVLDARRNQELGVGYDRAQRQGLIRGTPEYFAFLDDFMGFKKAEVKRDEESEDDITVSAPVTREGGSMTEGNKSSDNRIVLTPEQREFARTMGISEVEYARQQLKLKQDKKENPERYGMGRS